MKTFNDMNLPDALRVALEKMKFQEPTPIQAKAIPIALAGRDIIGSAQTGTGKTAAFGIPIISKLLTNQKGCALVLTPTRELATQVMDQLRIMLGRNSKVKTALLIGGESMVKQFKQLDQTPRLVVGTPGRINDHLARKSLRLSQTDFLVLDETDRMLDMGFTIQIEKILAHLAPQRQTLLFSATLPKHILKMSEKYLTDPEQIAVSSPSSPPKNIKQDIFHVTQSEKYPKLLSELEERQGSVIIFVKTKFGTERMAKKLSGMGHSADAIHGDLRQSRRDRVISSFRNKKYRILVATDVAARGLDIPHIEHVINYDLPQCPEDYIHRIGRTARAGATGMALNLVAPDEKGKWRDIHKLLNPGAAMSEPKKNTPKGQKFRNKPKKTSGHPQAKKSFDSPQGKKKARRNGPKKVA